MPHVIVMSGVSGSGKTTYALKKLVKGKVFEATNRFAKYTDSPDTVIVSADHYYLELGGGYSFRPNMLSSAHAMCFYAFIDTLQASRAKLVIVDNTCTVVEEISPYILGADAYGYTSEVITLGKTSTELKLCAERNLHGVSQTAIEAQWDCLSHRILPPWWKHTWV